MGSLEFTLVYLDSLTLWKGCGKCGLFGEYLLVGVGGGGEGPIRGLEKSCDLRANERPEKNAPHGTKKQTNTQTSGQGNFTDVGLIYKLGDSCFI